MQDVGAATTRSAVALVASQKGRNIPGRRGDSDGSDDPHLVLDALHPHDAQKTITAPGVQPKAVMSMM